MPPPLGLVNLSASELAADAGGDPWKIDDELRSGNPGEINAFADAYHTAAGSATEIESDFNSAKQSFEKGWQHNGAEHPINESAEVTKVTGTLHLQKAQLGQIALDLELIAAALAQAQSTSDAAITALDGTLHQIDDAMTAAKAKKQDTQSLHTAAVTATRNALGSVTVAAGKYKAVMALAESDLNGVTHASDGVKAVTGVTEEQENMWTPTLGDVFLGSSGAITGITTDGVRGAALKLIEESPGEADPGLMRWLSETKIGGFSRMGGLMAVVGAVPAVFSDINDGNSVTEAVTREGVGTAAGYVAGGLVGGLAAGAVEGAAIGSVIPGAGTAVGLVVGAGVGAVVAWGGSKAVEAAWKPVTGAIGSVTHSVGNFFSGW